MKKTIIKDTFTTDGFTEFLNQSEEIKRYNYITKGYRHKGNVIVANDDDETLKFTSINKCLYYVHNRFFIKSDIYYSFTLYKKTKTAKVWCGFDAIKLRAEFNEIFKYLNITWINEIDVSVINKCLTKTLFCDIISGKITNQSQFFKKYMSISLKIPKKEKASWKLMKESLTKCSSLCIRNDISLVVNNVKNINLGLKKFNDLFIEDKNCLFHCKKEYPLFMDALKDAEILGVKINPKWSDKRLRNEHTLMTQKINKFLIDEKSEKAIPFIGDDILLSYPNDTVKILDSESSVFQEALNMHHCLYTSYWTLICGKGYFAFSAKYPERCTIGVHRNWNGEFVIDQICGNYDKKVSNETYEYFNRWVKSENMQNFFKINYLKIKTDNDDQTEITDVMVKSIKKVI